MMVNTSSSVQADIELLDHKVAAIKKKLKSLTKGDKAKVDLDGLAKVITKQLKFEEKVMEKIGLSLTPVHKDEHQKLLQEITLLEFSWKAKRITDDVYIKAINYKMEFHDHYFDRPQKMLMISIGENSEE